MVTSETVTTNEITPTNPVPVKPNDMKTQHTPGPWQVASNDFCSWVTNSVGKAQIAKAFHPAGMTAETHKANETLIAAAPELLAALRTMFEKFGGEDILNTFVGGPKHDACKAARAAIAKATGNQTPSTR